MYAFRQNVTLSIFIYTSIYEGKCSDKINIFVTVVSFKFSNSSMGFEMELTFFHNLLLDKNTNLTARNIELLQRI